jgi:2-polyprenyl-6-methoxyphenol hydroxylase-like FAD-dependent oxidoreductase
MSEPAIPLIVGAGPVGLAAALFLARRGHAPRLIELRHEASKESKALAVNPRTLDLLKPTGVTERMLELGKPIRGVYFYRMRKPLAHFTLSGLHPDYPFMLALSQASTERLLAGALQQAGGTIERGKKLVQCQGLGGGVEATIEPSDGGAREVADCLWLLAADGAHSVARREMQIEFSGSSFPDDWCLADSPIRTSLADDHGHVFFEPDGAFLFMFPVIDDELQKESPAPLWRVIMNRADPLSQLIEAEPAGPAIWESRFRIAHRINATFSKGGVYFAGDAAHIHSPIGARGMNLGIEDAWVFAELAGAGRLHEYDELRRPVDRAVVRRVEVLSRITTADSPPMRFAREWLLPTAINTSIFRKQMLRVVSGLDHPLPESLTGKGRGDMQSNGRTKDIAATSGKASAFGATAVGAAATGTRAIGSTVLGALALGALAIGTVAIGRLLIRCLAVRDAHIRSLVIDELTIKRFVTNSADHEETSRHSTDGRDFTSPSHVQSRSA